MFIYNEFFMKSIQAWVFYGLKKSAIDYEKH